MQAHMCICLEVTRLEIASVLAGQVQAASLALPALFEAYCNKEAASGDEQTECLP